MTELNSSMRGFARAQQLLRKHVNDRDRPVEFDLLGLRWTLLDGVFAPIYTPVTELFTNWLPYPVDGTLLEVGSGTGVTAVWAALSGCKRVTAVDIDTNAIENTRRNIERHGVIDRVDVRLSNLFNALSDDERFDLIYWNSNFAEPPHGFAIETSLHHAFFDPGYETHRRYLIQAPHYLSEHGRLLLGFSDLGNWEQLRTACTAACLVPRILHAEVRRLESDIEFQLVELIGIWQGFLPGAAICAVQVTKNCFTS
jgi:release factor glutamine methyltransferase